MMIFDEKDIDVCIDTIFYFRNLDVKASIENGRINTLLSTLHLLLNKYGMCSHIGIRNVSDISDDERRLLELNLIEYKNASQAIPSFLSKGMIKAYYRRNSAMIEDMFIRRAHPLFTECGLCKG